MPKTLSQNGPTPNPAMGINKLMVTRYEANKPYSEGASVLANNICEINDNPAPPIVTQEKQQDASYTIVKYFLISYHVPLLFFIRFSKTSIRGLMQTILVDSMFNNILFVNSRIILSLPIAPMR